MAAFCLLTYLQVLAVVSTIYCYNKCFLCFSYITIKKRKKTWLNELKMFHTFNTYFKWRYYMTDILAMNNIFSKHKKSKLVSYGRHKIYTLSGSRFWPEWRCLEHFSERWLSIKKQADQSTSTKGDRWSGRKTNNKRKHTHTTEPSYEHCIMTLEMAPAHVHTRQPVSYYLFDTNFHLLLIVHSITLHFMLQESTYNAYVVSTYSFMQHMGFLFGGVFTTTCCVLFLITYKWLCVYMVYLLATWRTYVVTSLLYMTCY